MISNDDSERALLAFYGMDSLHPKSLADLNIDTTDPVDVDDINNMDTQEQYDLLNQLVKGVPDSTTGAAKDVQNQQYHESDIEDPLRGQGTNVIKELIRQQVISSKNDPAVNEYLISSREFNSQAFLTTVHKDTPVDDLVQGLEFLSKTIDSQRDELKQTIDDNYVNFVDCKDAIDKALQTFKNSKTRAQQEMEKVRIYNPSDRSRRKSMSNDRFLLSDIEDSIKNLTMLTSTMIRPIKENKLKEDKISGLIDFINKNKFLFDLPSKLITNVNSGNHDEIIDDLQRYTKLKKQLIEQENSKLRALKDASEMSGTQEVQKHQSINTLLIKIFNEVDKIVDEYRKSTYNELLSFDHENSGTKFSRSNNTRFLSLVDKIDQLNGDLKNLESPINTFLKAQLKEANKDFSYQFDKFENKFGSMQKKLLDYMQSLSDHRPNGSYIKYIGDKYKNLEEYFKMSSSTKSPNFEEKESIVLDVFDSSDNLDLSLINETWLIFLNFINYLNDIFLKKLNKFVNNYSYYRINNKNIDEQGTIRADFVNLVVAVTTKLYEIFNGHEDTTANQLDSSPSNYSNILPYYTNSLSTIFYISKISDRINTILSNFGKNVNIINRGSSDTNRIIKNFRNISSSINQKVLEATCSVWVNDCSQFFELENWEIEDKLVKFNDQLVGSNGNEEVSYSSTKLVNIIDFYSVFMLRKIKNLMFINIDTTDENYVKIVTSYPNKKMLVSIEIQFMRCLSILVDSIMKKYNIELQTEADDSKIFKVLTMNNFDKISRVVYPNLIKNYDTKFDKDLSSQNLKLFSDIDKASLTILDDILSKEKLVLDEILSRFFNKINTQKPPVQEIKIDNAIYEILIHFVKLVYNIKPITNKDIFINIINELQNFFLKNFLDYFRSIKVIERFECQLVNLRLDINFFIEIFETSKTLKLNEYSFNIAEVILSSIAEMETKKVISDKEFDSVLIRGLKESTNQFDCLSR